MTRNPEEKTTGRKNLPDRLRKWGQVCLVISVVLNGMVLAVNLFVQGLEGELQEKRYEEQYFIFGDQTLRAEEMRYQSLHAFSNQLVLLRKLADSRLTSIESQTIRNNVKELERQCETSKVNMVAISYLLTHDPPHGTNVYKMFEGKSDTELARLQEQYENQANAYTLDHKAQMVRTRERISFWKISHSVLLVLSTMVLIVGSFLTFRSEIRSNS